jgi:hypothetical protein
MHLVYISLSEVILSIRDIYETTTIIHVCYNFIFDNNRDIYYVRTFPSTVDPSFEND